MSCERMRKYFIAYITIFGAECSYERYRCNMSDTKFIQRNVANSSLLSAARRDHPVSSPTTLERAFVPRTLTPGTLVFQPIRAAER